MHPSLNWLASQGAENVREQCSTRHRGRNAARDVKRKPVNGGVGKLIWDALYHDGDLAPWQPKILWRPISKVGRERVLHGPRVRHVGARSWTRSRSRRTGWSRRSVANVATPRRLIAAADVGFYTTAERWTGWLHRLRGQVRTPARMTRTVSGTRCQKNLARSRPESFGSQGAAAERATVTGFRHTPANFAVCTRNS
jgi:hypothetical protein